MAVILKEDEGDGFCQQSQHLQHEEAAAETAHNPLSVSVPGPDLDIPTGLRPPNPCHAHDHANNVYSHRTSSAPC